MAGDHNEQDHLDDDRPHNVAQCLLALGITPDIRDGLFVDCDSMEDEFQVIKTLYRAKILEDHPDKVKTSSLPFLCRGLSYDCSFVSSLSFVRFHCCTTFL